MAKEVESKIKNSIGMSQAKIQLLHKNKQSSNMDKEMNKINSYKGTLDDGTEAIEEQISKTEGYHENNC